MNPDIYQISYKLYELQQPDNPENTNVLKETRTISDVWYPAQIEKTFKILKIKPNYQVKHSFW